jgi:hypothetical protein
MKKPLFLLVCVLLLILAGASPALAHGRTFVVHPSGGDDTATIQQAFADAVAAGPGSTVQLTKGHFYMNNIAVLGFRGCFMGAGMGRTVIDTVRGLDPSDPSLPGVTLTVDPEAPWTEDGSPNYLTGFTWLIGFLKSDVRVSDMSFEVTAYNPSIDGLPDNGGTNLSDVFLIYRDSSAAFDRIGIKAHEGDVNDLLNIEGAFSLMDTSGTVSVTRCHWACNSGPEVGYIEGARLTIGGSPAMGNRFDMYGYGGFFTDISDSTVKVSHNRISAVMGGGVYISQTSYMASPGMSASRFIIRDNRIVATQGAGPDGTIWGAAGVILEDDPWTSDAPVPVRLNAVVADNTIVLDNGGRAGGVDGLGARGIRVMDNHISGTGIAGIDAGADIYSYFGYPTGPGDGWRIIGNDVSHLHLFNDYDGPVAPIWLGTASSHCLVVGCGGRPTGVLDQGTDNILFNAIRLRWPAASRAAAPLRAAGMTKVPGPAAKF